MKGCKHYYGNWQQHIYEKNGFKWLEIRKCGDCGKVKIIDDKIKDMPWLREDQVRFLFKRYVQLDKVMQKEIKGIVVYDTSNWYTIGGNR